MNSYFSFVYFPIVVSACIHTFINIMLHVSSVKLTTFVGKFVFSVLVFFVIIIACRRLRLFI